MEILDAYITETPSIQNALDIFKGEWSSKFPGYFKSVEAGKVPVFHDPRILWPVEKFGGIQGQNVLELGPLEAGHTCMLEQLGAGSIISIEANTRAYLKCLIVKEVMGLTRAHFLCGDFVKYLQTKPGRFDACFASGVLYHMTEPALLLNLISQVTDKVFIWTHYYQADLIANNPLAAHRFNRTIETEVAGFKHTLYCHEYLNTLELTGFCGGSNPYSCWMTREDILGCLQHLGFTDIDINFDEPDHPHGPCFGVTALRPSSNHFTSQSTNLSVESDSEKVKKLQWQLDQTKLEIDRIQTQNQQTQIALKKSQSDWQLSQTQLQQTQTERDTYQTQFQQTQKQLADLQELNQNLSNQLDQIKQELVISHQTITAMKTSKFWKLRKQWFKLKKMIGLNTLE
jgi:Holliday junction resolvase